MSYDRPITNYRVKDDLKVGDPAKRVLGGELSKDFEAIAKAITDLENKVLLPNTDSDINFCGAVDATSTFHYPGGLRSVQGGDIYLTTTAGKAAPEWIGLDGAELNVGNAIGFSAVEGKWYLIGDIAGVEGQEGPQGEQGEQGEKGDDGEPGADGKDGADGTDGVDGKDGVDGEDGLPGADGADGKDGKPGVDGENGLPGVDGADGKDGTDGKDGADGKDGVDGVDGKDAEDGMSDAPSDGKYYGRKNEEWSYLSFDTKNQNRRLTNIVTARLATNQVLPEYTNESNFALSNTDGTYIAPEVEAMANYVYLHQYNRIAFNNLNSTMIQLQAGDHIEFSNIGSENQCLIMTITAADIEKVGNRYAGVFDFEIKGHSWEHTIKEGLQYTFHAVKGGAGGDFDSKPANRRLGNICTSRLAPDGDGELPEYTDESVFVMGMEDDYGRKLEAGEMAGSIYLNYFKQISFNSLESTMVQLEVGDYIEFSSVGVENQCALMKITAADIKNVGSNYYPRFTGVFEFEIEGTDYWRHNLGMKEGLQYTFHAIKAGKSSGGGGEGFLKSVDEIEFDYNTEGPIGDVVSWSFNDTYNNVSSDFKITWGKRYYGPLRNVAEGHWIQSSPNGVGLHASKSDGSKESFYWANPAGYAQIYASTTTQIFSPSIALAAPNGGTADGEAAIKLKNNGTSTFKHAIKAADFLDRQGNSIIGAGGGLWTDDGKLGISYGEADGNQGNVNIYGEDRYKPQLCLQGPVGSTPSIWFRGASLGMMDNPLYCQVKASAAGHYNGQELQVWTVTGDEGGYGHQPFVFGSNGTFFIQPDRSTDAVNYDVTAGFRNDGGKLQFRHESGRWNDLTDLGGSTRSVSPTQLIETLSTLRDATQDETTVEGLRDAIGNAIGGIIEKFEAQIKTVREMSQ